MRCPFPIYVKKIQLYVPCGKCGACLKRAISDWTLRLKQEMKVSSAAYFTTLTYETSPTMELCKLDLQKYFKRLRKLGFKFSYFALGDYGDVNQRPHYHVIFFAKGYFDQSLLYNIWTSGKAQQSLRGFIDVKRLQEGAILYVVRYGLLAKLDWDKSDTRPKPFFLMSKKPALGSNYISANMKRYHADWSNPVTYMPEYNYKKALPRFYKDKILSKPLKLKIKEQLLQDDLVRQDQVLADIERSNPNVSPQQILYARQVNSANQYLESLRDQKKRKSLIIIKS